MLFRLKLNVTKHILFWLRCLKVIELQKGKLCYSVQSRNHSKIFYVLFFLICSVNRDLKTEARTEL